jgi:ferrochelatase
MFLTSFIYKEIKYQNIKIPYIFIDYFKNILSFLQSQQIEYDIQKCDFTSHFYPIFVDNNLNIKPFGKSQRVIICSDENIEPEISWAKIIKISSINELKNLDFNFAIIDKNYKDVIEELTINQKQTGLF